MHAMEIISVHPDVRGSTNDVLIECIESVFDCAQVATSCADACLAEDEIDMLRQCVRLNLDCADICTTTGHVATRRAGSNERVLMAALNVCELACRVCAQECEQHAEMHEHCRITAYTCRRTAHLCRRAARSIQEH